MEKIVILTIFVIIIVGAKYAKVDWMSPACINLYWNFFFVFFAVIVFGGGIAWNYTSLLWVSASCMVFLLGQEAGNRVAIICTEKEVCKHGVKKITFFALIIIIVVGLINPLLYIYTYGYTIKDIFDFSKFLEINAVIAANRYSGNPKRISSISLIIGAMTYMGGLCGGYLFNYSVKKTQKIISVAVIIPMLALALVTNAKVGVIAIIFLWAVGWILSYININGNFLMLLRIGSFNAEARRLIADKLQIYAVGQVNSFAVWFTNLNDISYSMGTATYMAIPNLLGLTVRKQGAYELMDGVVSNIYTQNRGIIEDFGVIGGLVFWCVLGIVAGILYRRVKSRARMSAISISMLGAVYFTILYGFIISPWIYTSYMLAFIGFGVFLIFIRPRNFQIAEE